ncbi:MAG: prephenate dehydratase domain-containing protein, partial [Acidimicrobiia bacterium]
MNDKIEPGPGDIEQIRDDIDRIDADILKLLAERKAHSLRIAKEKGIHDRPSRDQLREEDLISDRIATGMDHDLDSGLVNRLWRDIVNDSVRIQQEYLGRIEGPNQAMTVAIQGIEGSYSQLASQQYFDHKGIAVSYVRAQTFADAVAGVQEGEAEVAVLPIENTTSGAISEVYDLLLDSRLHFIGDVRFRIRHCLLGIEGATVSELRRIYCHPQAVAQCSEFLAQLDHCEVVYFSDTALSGQKIR